MTLLERIQEATELLEKTAKKASPYLWPQECEDAAALLREAREEVALLREWYAADLEMDAAEAELRTTPRPGEIRSNGFFVRAQKRKWAVEEAIRAALKGATDER